MLPAAVRDRVGALAVEAFGELTVQEVPAPLRAVHRFAPARRARLATPAVVARLERDEAFRRRVAAQVRLAHPDLAEVVEHAEPPGAVDPGELAAVAYLLRPPGWLDYLPEVLAAHERLAAERVSATAQTVAGQLQDELATVRAAADRAVGKLRAELEEARITLDQLRREARTARSEAQAARAEAAALARERDRALEEARAARAERDQISKDAEARAAAAQAEAAAHRLDARRARALEETRARLLVDTIVAAAGGLRRELALPPVAVRPADAAAGQASAGQTDGGPGVDRRGRPFSDPRLLDELASLPQAHLIVDGYNVTKTGFGELPLATQRQRLLAGLSGIAAQTHAEITCCFDGTALEGRVPVSAPRGVRVLFSQPGETADELIRVLVHAEPQGRPVIVVSSDREVADAARRAGAYALPATAILRRLSRG